jgi:hypothetical protein
MHARDTWIGWDESARQYHLARLINNSRFLILPWVSVPHLASHVLGLALRHIARDWHASYGLRPWLVETLVDTRRFASICYRAANWIEVGATTGRGRNDRYHQRYGDAPKTHFRLSAAFRCRARTGFGAIIRIAALPAEYLTDAAQ